MVLQWLAECLEIKNQNAQAGEGIDNLTSAIHEKENKVNSSNQEGMVTKEANFSETDEIIENEDEKILNVLEEMKTSQNKIEEKLVEYGNGIEELKRKMEVIHNYVEEKKQSKEVKPGYKFVLKLDRPHDMALLSIIFLQLLYVCIVITFVLM